MCQGVACSIWLCLPFPDQAPCVLAGQGTSLVSSALEGRGIRQLHAFSTSPCRLACHLAFFQLCCAAWADVSSGPVPCSAVLCSMIRCQVWHLAFFRLCCATWVNFSLCTWPSVGCAMQHGMHVKLGSLPIVGGGQWPAVYLHVHAPPAWTAAG